MALKISYWPTRECGESDMRPDQNNTFIAHCIERAAPCDITGFAASTSGVDPIVPKMPLSTLVVRKTPKFARFSRLKISQRSWSLASLFSLKVFRTDRSHCARPGRRLAGDA